MGLWERIRKWVNRLFSKKDVEQALNIKVVTPPALLQKFDDWRNAMDGTMPHNVGPDGVPSQYTAATLVSRVAKLTMLEFKSEVTGSPMADYINEQYTRFVKAKPKGLRAAIEDGLSGGRYLLYPSVRGEDIEIATLENNGYFPTRYDELGNLAAVVVPLGFNRDEKYYTLLVACDYNDAAQTYTMEHTAWVSEEPNTIGKVIPLTNVEEWAALPPSITYTEVEQPWFIEYVAPNNGMAIFDKALDLFRKLDRQKDRTEWEFEGGELAVDVPTDMWRNVGKQNAKDPRQNEVILEVPKGKARLYRNTNIASHELKPTTYNPEFRDESLARGSNSIKCDIEDACEVARGTISDVNLEAKTATEIKATQHITFTTIEDVQGCTQAKLEKLLTVIARLAWQFGLAPKGDYEATFDWDDSVIVSQEEWQKEVTAEFNNLLRAYSEGALDLPTIRAFMDKNFKYLPMLTDDEIRAAAKKVPGAFDDEDDEKETEVKARAGA